MKVTWSKESENFLNWLITYKQKEYLLLQYEWNKGRLDMKKSNTDLDLPDDLEDYKLVDADVLFHCPTCKVDVPKEDAFIVVSSCSINQKKKQVLSIPNRAFHFNFNTGITCRADLEIKENSSGKKE